jgi:hypothetical protein
MWGARHLHRAAGGRGSSQSKTRKKESSDRQTTNQSCVLFNCPDLNGAGKRVWNYLACDANEISFRKLPIAPGITGPLIR